MGLESIDGTVSSSNAERHCLPCHQPSLPLHTNTHPSTLRKQIHVEFHLGDPFLPFQQLLAVLPAASAKLLPAPYQVGGGSACASLQLARLPRHLPILSSALSWLGIELKALGSAC